MKRVALITGGGTGIGRGIALALARRGFDVGLAGRRLEPLWLVAEEAKRYGVRAVALPADIASSQELPIVIERARQELGPLDILVNNAGTLAGGMLATLATEAIERAVATNLTAPLLLTHLALPDLVARRGAVVLVGSMASLLPLPFASLYSATKSGLHGLAASLRYELEPLGVRLLVAYPPATATAMTEGMARAAGFAARMMPMAAPEAIGEQIVEALLAGQQELVWPSGELFAARLYHWAPWLVRPLFRFHRARFARMMSASSREEGL